MMALRLATLAGVLLALGGCAIVEVRADGERPRLSAWPLGVRIERGAADAIAVRQTAIGAWSGCGAAGIGFGAIDCLHIDARTCGVALIERPAPEARGVLAQISDQTRAKCLAGSKGE